MACRMPPPRRLPARAVSCWGCFRRDLSGVIGDLRCAGAVRLPAAHLGPAISDGGDAVQRDRADPACARRAQLRPTRLGGRLRRGAPGDLRGRRRVLHLPPRGDLLSRSARPRRCRDLRHCYLHNSGTASLGRCPLRVVRDAPGFPAAHPHAAPARRDRGRGRRLSDRGDGLAPSSQRIYPVNRSTVRVQRFRWIGVRLHAHDQTVSHSEHVRDCHVVSSPVNPPT